MVLLLFLLFLLWQNLDKSKKTLDKLSFVFMCSRGIRTALLMNSGCMLEGNNRTKYLWPLARFHCHFWERNNILDGVERGGFWVLARRKITGDLDSAEANWKALLERLPELRELGLVSLDNICSEVLRQVCSFSKSLTVKVFSNLRLKLSALE